MMGLRTDISPEDVCDLFNLAATFVEKFLSLQHNFLGEASRSSDESTGNSTNEDEGEKFDEPPESPDVKRSTPPAAQNVTQAPAPQDSGEKGPQPTTSKVEYVYFL